MSFDKLLRDMVRDEVERALAPISASMAQMESIVGRLAGAFGQPIKRGPGRPPKALTAVKVKGKRGRRKAAEGGARLCALEGCGRPARSKGYCAAHYQKLRMLDRTGRLPSDWVEYAPEGSVKNLVLPRGRAGAKALAEAKKKK